MHTSHFQPQPNSFFFFFLPLRQLVMENLFASVPIQIIKERKKKERKACSLICCLIKTLSFPLHLFLRPSIRKRAANRKQDFCTLTHTNHFDWLLPKSLTFLSVHHLWSIVSQI